MAGAADGTFLVRIEDIDQSRARPDWEAAIFEDLRWLGLRWAEPVMRQSDRLPAYRAALEEIWHRQLLFRCVCNRRDIASAAAAPQEGAPVLGPDGLVYPGTCRGRFPRTGPLPEGAVLRLDMTRAADALDGVEFDEAGAGPGGETGRIATSRDQLTGGIGDVVLARREFGTSYHLAVTVDDAAQHVTLVTRGQDLFEATAIHVVLQRLLGLPTPRYHHHRLIRDETGRRLAKRDDARALARYRAEGLGPGDIRRMVGLAGTG